MIHPSGDQRKNPSENENQLLWFVMISQKHNQQDSVSSCDGRRESLFIYPYIIAGYPHPDAHH